MAYLDNFLKAKSKSKRVAKGQKRQHLVKSAADLLDNWRNSHFEFEGACRSGLRSAMCLEGYDWQNADDMAADIVGAALRSIGAERPDWDEGQREFVTGRENCAWCGCEVEMKKSTRNRFCSVDCAQRSINARNDNHRYADGLVGRAAFRLIKRVKTKVRNCLKCGDTFHPQDNSQAQRYCGNACYHEATKIRPTIQCERCEAPFVQEKDGRKFCSRACYEAQPIEPKFEKNCQWCKAPFTAKMQKAFMCSTACRNARNNHVKSFSRAMARASKSNVIDITPYLFDGEFRDANLRVLPNILDENIFDRLFG
jgi:hypothetical protein